MNFLRVNTLKVGIFSLFFLMLSVAVAPFSHAEDPIIASIEVRGNNTVSKQTIVSQIRSIPGRPMSPTVLSEDLKRLYGLGFFKDVQIKQEPIGSQVRIIFIVEEKTIVKEVIILGNQQIKTKDVEKNLRAKPGDFFDEQVIRRDIDSIRKLYEDKGFYDVSVGHRVQYDPATNHAVLTYQVNEGQKVIIKRILFEGVNSVETKDLLKTIQTKPQAWWGLVPGNLREDVLELDIQRIRSVYDENGFSDAKITYRLDPAGKSGEVDLVFIANEGQQYLVGDVSILGNEIFSTEEVMEVLPLNSGSPFSRRGLRKSVTSIQDLYFSKGYMNAKVIFDSIFNESTGNVDTSYKITENNITHVNHVKVRGNSKTQDIVIRRELRVYPGEPFDGEALKRSKERLFNLGYFEEVQFDTVDTEDPDFKDLVVGVKETKTGEFSFGGGFSSIDRALGFIQLRQRNFDYKKWPTFTGAGQDLSLRLQLGSVRSQGELSWTDPWFMGYPFSFGFDLYRREFDRTRSSGLFFDEERTGGRIRVGKELTDHDRLSLIYGYERVDISSIPDTASADLKAEEGENDLSRVGLTYTRDYRDNRFVPTKGYLFQIGGEVVGGVLGGDKDFWRSTALASAYKELITDQILELKIRGGVSDAYDDTAKVPIFERFYAGGANTIRGYRERRIGPRDSGTGDPIGGEAYWVTNVEYVVPVVEGVLKAAAFYDVGNVYDEIEDFGDGSVFQGVGLGVRLNTPIGPIKIDAGYPLDDIEGEDKEVQFYFNMSRGF